MATKQVILNGYGNSWLGFYTSNEKFTRKLNELLGLSGKKKYYDHFWLLNLEGEVVEEFDGFTYISDQIADHLILVHSQKYFV